MHAYVIGLVNELERNRKRLSDKLHPKRIIKLYTTVGIQELRVTTDTNNNAFVKEGLNGVNR